MNVVNNKSEDLINLAKNLSGEFFLTKFIGKLSTLKRSQLMRRIDTYNAYGSLRNLEINNKLSLVKGYKFDCLPAYELRMQNPLMRFMGFVKDEKLFLVCGFEGSLSSSKNDMKKIIQRYENLMVNVKIN